MLQILINGSPALLKSGGTFDLVRENPMFTNAEAYTLALTFPIRGCTQNARIFGYIVRQGHAGELRAVDMTIIDRNQRIEGVGVISSITDAEVKLQFLSGKSAENYMAKGLDEIYINELDLGSVPTNWRKAADCSPDSAWGGRAFGNWMVAIPWVNMDTGTVQNDVKWIGNDSFNWNPPKDTDLESYGLSWMPFMREIAEKIAEAAGFSHDFEAWKNSKWNDLLICNAVPYTWDYEWATILPHWSVAEFFHKLEPLLEGVFDIDTVHKKISFRFYEDAPEECFIETFDEFTSEVFEEDDECKYVGERYMGYAFGDSDIEKTYSCPHIIDNYSRRKDLLLEFDDADAYAAQARSQNWSKYDQSGGRSDPRQKLSHIKDWNRYAVIRNSLRGTYGCLPGGTTMTEQGLISGTPITTEMRPWGEPVMLNQFGPRNIPEGRDEKQKGESPDETLDFIPVLIDNTEFHRHVFLNPGTYEGTDEVHGLDENDQELTELRQPLLYTWTRRTKKDKPEYYSKISVGFYPSRSLCTQLYPQRPVPLVDNCGLDLHFKGYRFPEQFTLSLNDGKYAGLPRLDTTRKYEFSFLADVLPEVRPVYHIRGKRYLCEKITATFSEWGMSQKIKGTFWRIID